MAFIPATNTVRVAVEMNQKGHVTVNVYHVLSPAPIASADLTTIAGVFASWLTNHLLPLISSTVSVTNLNLRDLTTSSSLILDSPMTTGNVGGTGGDPLPNSNALVASWRTGFSGRSFRGRTYIPGLTVINLVGAGGNTVVTADATAFATAMSVLQTAVNTAGYDLVVASFRHAGAPRTSAVLTQPDAVIVNTHVDNQRRRLKGAS